MELTGDFFPSRESVYGLDVSNAPYFPKIPPPSLSQPLSPTQYYPRVYLGR